MTSGRKRSLHEALLGAAGMVLFALFVRSGLPWSLASDLGLAMAAVAVLLSLYRERTMAGLLGFVPFGGRAALFGVLGTALGIGFGLLFRWKFGLHWLGELGQFAPVAAAIGGVEELYYRGYLQGRLTRINAVVGVIGAAVAHTAYKAALFLLPALSLSNGPAAAQVDWIVLVFWTFLVGLLFGALRQAARNIAPALAAHVAFDVVVYGGLSSAPWWVWN
jgi:membrane protease YdiL (CAAX protease family)